MGQGGDKAIGRQPITYGGIGPIASGRPHRRTKGLDVLAFLVPASLFIEVKVGGRLFAPDLLLAGLLPFLLLANGGRLRAKLPRTFLILCAFWLAGQIMTDLLRETPFQDFSRGWSKILFTMTAFGSMYILLYGRPRRLLLYALGLAVGASIGYFLNPDKLAHYDAWKYGFGSPVTLLMVLVAVALTGPQRWRRLLPGMILVSAAAINIYMGFRSLGAICFVTGCYILVQAVRGRWNSKPRLRLTQLLITAIVTLFAAWGVLQTYSYAAKAGWLGSNAKYIFEMQATGEYGILLGGRSEIFASSVAVMHSPLIGHGSWAKDCYYASLVTESRRRLGYGDSGEAENCLIPTHSHLLGAWVEAGLLGAVFWAWLLTLPARAVVRLYSTAERLTPLIVFLALLLVWDIFFSPYSAERRFVTTFYAVLLMSYLPTSPKRFRKIMSPAHAFKKSLHQKI